jgi:hypothetical protein
MKENSKSLKKSLRKNSRKFEGVSMLKDRDPSLTLLEDLTKRVLNASHFTKPKNVLPRKTKNPYHPEYEVSTEFNEDKWKQIRPLLQQAWDEAVLAGKSSSEFIRLALDGLDLKGKIYLEKFINEEIGKGATSDQPGSTEKAKIGRSGDADIADNTSEGREVAARSDRGKGINLEKLYHVIWDDNSGNHIESYDKQKDAERRVAQLLIKECEEENNGCIFNTVIFGEILSPSKLIVHVEADDGRVSVKFKI